MAKEREQEFVNPKWLLRQISKACPEGLAMELCETVRALWAYSDSFIPEDDALSGDICFAGSVSYTQLDEYFRSKPGAGKQRMERLRESGVVKWQRSKYGIKFVVELGSSNTDSSSEGTETLSELSEDGVTAQEPPTLGGEASSQGTEDSSEGFEHSSQGTKVPSQGSGTLLCLSGIKALAATGISVESASPSQKKTQDQVKGNPNTSELRPEPAPSFEEILAEMDKDVPVPVSAPTARPIPSSAPPLPKHFHIWDSEGVCAGCKEACTHRKVRSDYNRSYIPTMDRCGECGMDYVILYAQFDQEEVAKEAAAE